MQDGSWPVRASGQREHDLLVSRLDMKVNAQADAQLHKRSLFAPTRVQPPNAGRCQHRSPSSIK
jgi:hypothetical protein